MDDVTLIHADARRIPLADRSVHCCVTSPPYYGLRDYGVPGQLGLEPTPAEYVAAMVRVFREVRRVLRDDGTLWLNIGDSYSDAAKNPATRRKDNPGVVRPKQTKVCERCGGLFEGGLKRCFCSSFCGGSDNSKRQHRPGFLKAKDLIGIPWMLAFALRDDGWYLRQEIIWGKRNCMPESVRDRPSRAHEQVFLLTKRPRYFYDIDAGREPHTMRPQRRPAGRPTDRTPRPGQPKQTWPTAARDEVGVDGNPAGRNARSVWSITTKPFKGAHFATMPPDLAGRCIRLGTSEVGCCPRCDLPWRRIVERSRIATRPGDDNKALGRLSMDVGNRDPKRHTTIVSTLGWESSCTCLEPTPIPCTVFDPFGGAGTTIVVADALGRRGVMTELSAKYLGLALRRLKRPHAATPKPRASNEPDLPLFSRRDSADDIVGPASRAPS